MQKQINGYDQCGKKEKKNRREMHVGENKQYECGKQEHGD